MKQRIQMSRCAKLGLTLFSLIMTMLVSAQPSRAGELDISSIAAGASNSCALVSEEIYCWGNNDYGQLGTDAVSSSKEPLKIENFMGVTDLSIGDAGACAVKDAKAYCWGWNPDGRLGFGDKLDRSFPTLVPGLSGVTKVAIGPTSCAVANENVYCWGFSPGQSGTGLSDRTQLTPEVVENFSGVSDVSVGNGIASGTICAIKASHLYCWGANLNGGVGTGDSDYHSDPTQVAGLENVTAVSVSSFGTCAVNSGQVYCWSTRNIQNVTHISPRKVLGLNDVTTISNGYYLACAVSLGHVYCWGDNQFGQFGVGGVHDFSDAPVEALGLDQVSSVAVGTAHTCALQDSEIFCWGLNTYGQLGLGNTTDTNLPQVVRSLTGQPSPVTGIHIVGGVGTSTTLTWNAAEANGLDVTGYVVRTSSDGRTWSNPTELGLQQTYAVDTSGLTSASAIAFQVAAVNSKVQGEWSAVFPIVKRGTKAFNVHVQDADGHPIVGGSVTWQMADKSAKSSKAYGLTSDGLLALPQAPAGIINLTLVDGTLPDGSTISGTWQGILGLGEMVLEAPAAPVASRTIHVTLPRGDLDSGIPVSNTQVTFSDADGSAPTGQVEVSGFTFKTSVTSSSGLTDTAGDFTVRGYLDSPQADVDYDDGTITQHKTVDVSDVLTTVELDYVPWVSFDSAQVTSDPGAPQVVQVSAIDSASSSLRGPHYVTSSPVKAGVAVTLVPPRGVKAVKCANGKAQKLTGTTGANGKAKLTLCAYQSGIYTLKTAGAASVGSMRVLVKGAAPLAPTLVNVKSSVVGQLRASWNKPLYDGGSAITQYTITATAKGKPTVTKVIKATLSKKGAVVKAPATVQVLTGLANATVYTVTLTATTKNGTSTANTVKVPVA